MHLHISIRARLLITTFLCLTGLSTLAQTPTPLTREIDALTEAELTLLPVSRPTPVR